jgi:hypothetical protein
MVNQKTIYKFKPVLKMKKLVFTAIAAVVFSGVSFAGTKEVKEEVVVNNESKEVLKATPCEDAAIDFYEIIIGGGDDDIDLLNDLLSYCH